MPEDSAVAIDGTKPLPVVGDAIVRAARMFERREPMAKAPRRPRKATYKAVMDFLRKKATEEAPLTVRQIQDGMPQLADRHVSPIMSGLMLYSPHVHRRHVDTGRKNSRGHKIVEWAYWVNDSYANPYFGKSSLVQSKGNKAAPQVSSPQAPVPATTVELAIVVGGHSFFYEEARTVYDALKKVFGNG